jgi:microcystin degradation protein MlrC
VLSSGYLVPDLEDRCALNLMALTPGGVYADLETIPYTKVARPLYPQDREMEWSPSFARPWAKVPQDEQAKL